MRWIAVGLKKHNPSTSFCEQESCIETDGVGMGESVEDALDSLGGCYAPEDIEMWERFRETYVFHSTADVVLVN